MDEESARRWVGLVSSILFEHVRPGGSSDEAGVLHRARRRFVHEGREAVFDAVVGDGTLWLTLCAANAALPFERTSRIEKMHALMAWRALYSRHELLGTADRSRLHRLMTRLRAERARAALRGRGAAAAGAMREIEAWLVEHGSAEIARQAGRPDAFRLGDPLWGPRAGWAVAIKDAVQNGTRIQIYLYRRTRSVVVEPAGRYLNLRIAAGQDQDLAESLSAAGLR